MVPLGVLNQLLTAATLCCGNGGHGEGTAQASGTGMSHLPMPAVTACVTSHDGPWLVPQLRGLSRAVLDLAEHRLVMIAIDDLHHADQRSQQCLLSLFRRLAGARVLVVLTGCQCHDHGCLRLNAELLGLPRYQHIRLKLLSLQGTAEMLAEHLGGRRGQELAAQFHELTGGDPVLIRALLADFHASEKAGVPEVTPGASFSHAVLAGLYRGERATLEAARALAILDEHAWAGVLEEMLDLSPEAVALAIGALRARGLLDSGRFRHDSVRHAVRLSLDADQRATLNGRAAGALNKRGAHAAVVAGYIVAAGGLDAPWVVPTLREAAVQALGDDDISMALSCLRMAYRECCDERQQAAILAMLLRAQWRVNPSGAVQHLPSLSTTALETGLAESEAAAVAAYLLWFGQPDRAVKVLEAIDQLDRDGTAVPSPGANLDYGLVRGWLACGYPRLADALKPLSPSPLSVPRPSARGRSTLPATPLREVLDCAAAGATNGSAERVLEGSRLDDTTVASILAALLSLTYAEQHHEAREWCDALRTEAAERRAPMWQALFAATSSAISIRQGNIRAAELSAREALTLVTPEGWGVAAGLPLAQLLLSTTASGKFDEAAACLSIRVPDAMHETVAVLPYLRARGCYYLAVGRPHASLDDFQRCGDLMAEWDIDLPAFVPWRAGAAQVLLSFGEVDRARHLVMEQLSMLGPRRSRARGMSLRVLAAASEVGRRPELLRESADILAKAGDLFELALTVGDLGQVCYLLGDKHQAHALARRSARLAKACGAELPSSAKLRVAAAKTPERSKVPAADREVTDLVSQLSEAELRVAVLAARGHTNRQIAGMLFITVSTVEQHLTRVYRKLQTQCRTELAAILQGRVSWSAEPIGSWR
jgi:DNA-binding CsgD family transcriptional regulator